jgi:hypothetical protein
MSVIELLVHSRMMLASYSHRLALLFFSLILKRISLLHKVLNACVVFDIKFYCTNTVTQLIVSGACLIMRYYLKLELLSISAIK